MSYHSENAVHRQISAHLDAAGRNPGKADQHLLAATQLCEANNIPHFGRYDLNAIHAREAVIVQERRDRATKNRERAA